MQQPVGFHVSVLASSITQGTLVVQRVLNVQGGDNQCEAGMVQPSETQGGKSVSQITAISLAQVQTIFNYALSKNFFNAQLNSRWDSPVFQFNAGSLSQVLNGLSFQVAIAATGQCTTSTTAASKPLRVVGNQFQVSLDYSCTINTPGSQTSDPIVTFQFTLSGFVTVRYLTVHPSSQLR